MTSFLNTSVGDTTVLGVIIFLVSFVTILGLALLPVWLAWAKGIETGCQGAFSRKPK